MRRKGPITTHHRAGDAKTGGRHRQIVTLEYVADHLLQPGKILAWISDRRQFPGSVGIDRVEAQMCLGATDITG